jgi:hypothetical protein
MAIKYTNIFHFKAPKINHIGIFGVGIYLWQPCGELPYRHTRKLRKVSGKGAYLNFGLSDVVDDQLEVGELLCDGGHVAQRSGHHVQVEGNVVFLQNGLESI